MPAASSEPYRSPRILIGVVILVLLAVVLIPTDEADAGAIPPGEGIDVVYLAVGSNFPDALSVGPAAGAHGAPILLVPTDPPIPNAIEERLIALDPQVVVIVGGSAVVSPAMEAALAALLPNATLDRVAGANRYETSAALAANVFPIVDHVSIPAVAFSTDNEEDTGTYGPDTAFSAVSVLYAPVQIPHGARITAFEVAFYDSNAAENVTAHLWRTIPDSSEVLASVVTSGDAGVQEVLDTTIATGMDVVENSDHAYGVSVINATGSDLHVERVTVTFEVGTSPYSP